MWYIYICVMSYILFLINVFNSFKSFIKSFGMERLLFCLRYTWHAIKHSYGATRGFLSRKKDLVACVLNFFVYHFSILIENTFLCMSVFFRTKSAIASIPPRSWTRRAQLGATIIFFFNVYQIRTFSNRK